MKHAFHLLLLVTLILSPRLSIAQGNSPPVLDGQPPLRCVDPVESYVETICVRDEDLGSAGSNEQVTLRLLSPSWMTLSRSQITPEDGNICHPIEIRADGAQSTGKIRVTIEAVDRSGAADTLGYDLMVSKPLIFSMPVFVRNTRAGEENHATQELILGMGRNATSGEEFLGRLDSAYCEYELPPLPAADLFDVRWSIPTRNGILRNIQPENPNAGQGWLTWRGTFQPGYDDTAARYFPLVVCWSISDAQRFPSHVAIEDPLGQVFRVSMKSPYGNGVQLPTDGSVVMKIDGDTACVEIYESSSLASFYIVNRIIDLSVHGPSVEASGYVLSTGTPSPFSIATEIAFISPKRGSMRIELFDMNGVLVRILLDGITEAGPQSVLWDGTADDKSVAPAGTYLCTLSAGDVRIVRGVVLVR